MDAALLTVRPRVRPTGRPTVGPTDIPSRPPLRTPVTYSLPRRDALLGKDLMVQKDLIRGLRFTLWESSVSDFDPSNLAERLPFPSALPQEREPSPALPSTDLERVVAEFQQGIQREENFRRLFDHYFPAVQRFLARRVFSPEDRLDLTQEIFLRVYNGIEGFRGEAQFGTWVFRIAFNTWSKWLRQRSAAQRAEGDLEGEPLVWDEDGPTILAKGPSPLESTLDEERRLLLREAVRQLPDKMQQCTRLRIYQDLSYREIATTMRLSIETVKVHLFQARKKLREHLQDFDF